MGSSGSSICVNDNPPEKPHLNASCETVDAEASEDISTTMFESSGDRNSDHHEPENREDDFTIKKKSIQLYKCNVCSKKFNKKAYALKHCKVKHWTCEKCNTIIVNPKNIKRHIDRCSKPKPPKRIQTPSVETCPECNKTFPTKFNLERHRGVVHGVEMSGMFKCLVDNCNFATDVPKSMKKHTSSVHPQCSPVKCSKCEYQCFSKSGLDKHFKEDHCKTCSICSKTFRSERSLQLHILTVHSKTARKQGYHVVDKALIPGI